VQADTAFSIGSISKQFVSTLVLLLADDRKLSLSDPVAKYFPDLTRARAITLYDLMTPVSGDSDYFPLDFVDLEPYPERVREALQDARGRAKRLLESHASS
jgi:D-alanyl-D-alanine carboxypeptidase